MKNVEFNLLDESWIRVLLPDGSVKEVGIRDVLLHASDYVDLAGELPTQDIAVLRLLLAILHTVFSPTDEEGCHAMFSSTDDALIQWSELWNQGSFPEKPLEEYLEKWRQRFWLFHPERPFWQVPEAAIGTEYGAAKLNGELSESSNKLRLFAAYSGEGKTAMTYAQAARWLLYVNGYDDTSSKPKAKGRPSVGAGWLGKLGLILAQGSNLFETLMLNLTLLKDGVELWGPARPCWELEQARSEERVEISQPDNAAEWLTLQSRRLLLYRQEDQVVGYRLLGGDFFDRDNAFGEQMTVWRGVQEKKNKPLVFRPRRHNSAIQFWREFPTVFTEKPDTHQPGIVRWIVTLMDAACLNNQNMVRFRIAAVEYGDKDFFITDTFSDSLTFHRQLLNEMGTCWRNVITTEIQHCEELARQVGFLAKNLAEAAGEKEKTSTDSAQKQFYFRVDQPFRSWLYAIDPEWDEDAREENRLAWQKKAQQIAQHLGEQMVREAGTVAFVGRMVESGSGKGKGGEEGKRHISAPEAYNLFLYKVKQIYQG